jgi:hypothetical protein
LVAACLDFWDPSRSGSMFFATVVTDAGTGLVEFFAVCEVSFDMSFVSLLPGGRHLGSLIPLLFCSLHRLVLSTPSPLGHAVA